MSDSASRRPARESAKFSLSPRRIIMAVVAVLAVIFIAQNRSRVHIHFFTAEFSCPMWLLLVIMTVVGLGLGLGVSRRRRTRKRAA
ncbi:DUF1049 domain-containing protein [Streptacidiphilus sp. P02-A3a]|uniref:DUF1049 domain-containing protein n=1 Tax=Streptacidiphilus sp. P02-A3a TaxID=2704468 RepID=UPI0015FC5813|nr:DUF1049 domain-containing protein [Streptacidiphilus sp. P02-A3a]QMU69352.1 DUF1049 domain-containing protein [Streptacidiphilus sp. P02-A3a]